MVAFRGGAVMGLAVAGLGLLGVGVLALLFAAPEQAVYINGFAMGASSIALFARVGGGIYTKAADVGADLVGKVEAGIPEDDPRNPGVIADNVGDNVGDVAGMGADIFESYVGSMIATIAIAATLAPAGLEALQGGMTGDALKSALMGLPLALSAVGLVASLLGIVGDSSAQGHGAGGGFALLRLGRRGAVPDRRIRPHQRNRNQQRRVLRRIGGHDRGRRDRLHHRVLHVDGPGGADRRRLEDGLRHQHHLRPGGGLPQLRAAAGDDLRRDLHLP